MPPLSEEDARAIAVFQAGHPEAFEALYQRHRQRVFAQAWRMLRDEGLALDVAQDVFLALFRALPSWEAGAPLPVWLSETCWRLARSQMRRRPRRFTGEAEADTPASSLEEDEAARLWEAVGGLSERDRQAVLLRYAQQLSVPEVAETMGITPKAVSSHLARGLAVLRQIIRRNP